MRVHLCRKMQLDRQSQRPLRGEPVISLSQWNICVGVSFVYENIQKNVYIVKV